MPLRLTFLSVDLQSGGKLFYEIGYDQGEAVKNIMEAAGFLDVKVIKDFAGLDRMVTAKKQTINGDNK